jgi:hypothetical protein
MSRTTVPHSKNCLSAQYLLLLRALDTAPHLGKPYR